MNIVKFKDTIIEDEFFNNYLRGKYVYCINWTYIIPFSELRDNNRDSDYVVLSRNTDMIEEFGITHYGLYEDYAGYVDIEATSKANSIERFIYLNKFTPDDEITIEELRRFRQWLAGILLQNQSFIESYTDEVEKLNSMLKYYRDNMMDCTIKGLLNFTDKLTTADVQTSSCGCGSSNSVVQIGKVVMGTGGTTSNTSLQSVSSCGCGSTATVTPTINSLCEPILTYRISIYNYMVSIFSDIQYWINQVDICGEMKKYIDGIIKCDFKLASSLIDKFADCTCNNANSSEQVRLMNMLRNLSTALGYIINDQVSGNRNFISEAFKNWAKYLYEKMYWV